MSVARHLGAQTKKTLIDLFPDLYIVDEYQVFE